jgi:hypothetical protein
LAAKAGGICSQAGDFGLAKRKELSEMTVAEAPVDGAAYIRRQLDSRMVTGRYSSGFVTEMMNCAENGSANIFAILQEIEALEGAPSARPTRTKKAEEFVKPPLAGFGLWHKHYVSGSIDSIKVNVGNHWQYNFFDCAKEVMQDQAIPYEKKAEAISRKIVFDGYNDRSTLQKLTGEWIVYARHQGANHYLTLGKHRDKDAVLKHVLACCREFPYLDIAQKHPNSPVHK